ncbi:hypothetical protein PENSTE_c010G04561 [Penicillium steckii]|uniref:Smr domain-containing protein n=1 Tax=Penicillium steckii TaxID=303698 RepID=A0A1V6T7L4_9EURO|nr:hypothetical protein PENSTE_c010G04561 [Penicillium steckii]
MENDSDSLRAELEEIYCPPLDSALFAAIISDFNLTNTEDVSALRETLDSLKECAQLQENEIFDPSGTANDPFATENDIRGMLSEAGTSGYSGDSLHTLTDVTSMGSYLLSEETPGRNTQAIMNPNITYSVTADGSLELTGASVDDKVNLLTMMFPGISPLDVEQSLKKSDGDVDKSIDLLLNLSFFNESLATSDDSSISVPKGIDGFSAGNADIGRSKGRNKKRNKRNRLPLETSAGAEAEPVPTINKWETGQADIDFICSCIPDLTKGKISAIYHNKGMDLRATIKALALENPIDNFDINQDPVVTDHVAELTAVYPTISKNTLVGLLRLTGNKVTPANELAAVLLRQPSQTEISELIKFTPAPLNLDEDEDDNPGTSYSPGGNIYNNNEFENLRATANANFAASSAAHIQAAQAARRSRSNPLYGGASAYYRQVGQQHRERAMNQLAAASDQLVDRQSSNCDLDLHGVTVENAKRIVRERVAAWWESLGDAKYIRGGGVGVHGGYKIITGIGRHSRDGTSRLGPAVGKMLISEGWRVCITPGSLIVLGVARG